MKAGATLPYVTFRTHMRDEIYCMSFSDSFVMNEWAQSQGLKNAKAIPDGSGTFTRRMGMLIDKDNLAFGLRSWRYALSSGTVLSKPGSRSLAFPATTPKTPMA